MMNQDVFAKYGSTPSKDLNDIGMQGKVIKSMAWSGYEVVMTFEDGTAITFRGNEIVMVTHLDTTPFPKITQVYGDVSLDGRGLKGLDDD